MGLCISVKMRLVYYPVPKNACTTMRHCIFEQDNGFPFRPMRINGRLLDLPDLYGSCDPFNPVSVLPGYLKIAIVREPIRRFISAYKNRVLYYDETAATHMAKHGVSPLLPARPDIVTFVRNLDEYRKIPAINHHTNPQVLFLGREPAYYDRLFRHEEIGSLELFLAARRGAPVRLEKLRSDGPRINPEDVPADVRRLIASRYEVDYRFLGHLYAANALSN